MVRNTSRRAWVLKRNGLVAFGPGLPVTVFLIMMWLGSGYTLTRYHILVMVVAGGLLVTAVLCLVASGKVQDGATAAADARDRGVAEAAERERVRLVERREEAAAARRTRQAEQLPLEQWDDAITREPRPQLEGGVRPELRRGPRPSQAPRSPALSTTTSDGYAQ